MADTNIDFSTKYSLSSLLNNLLRINQNSLEIMDKLSDITTSNADTVEIEVLDENNQISKVFVPSYGQLMSDINRIDNNIKQLSGIGEANANVQLEDGSFRKLLLSNLKVEGNTIGSMATPTEFNTKTNWFFESFLNPLLYVSFNFSGQIPNDTERCKLQRFILNLDTQAQKDVWTNEINGQSNLDYVTFFQKLLKYNITYFLDEDVIDMPPRDLRFYGDFSVMRIFDEVVTEVVDGAKFTKRLFKVQLNTLNYNDSTSEYKRTQQLKIGDSIVIVGDNTNNNTRYQITNIDLDSGNIVEVKLLEGFDVLAIGTKCSYYNEGSAPIELDVNIGFNEYNVIFVKPINPITKVPALEWSPGSAFYTNNLSIITSEGEELSLGEYYREQVVDFGVFLYNMAKDGIPPATMAITPNKPLVESTDFQVLQINNHITDIERIDKIKSLQSEKLAIQSELKSLNDSIKEKRADMNTKRYTAQSQRDTDQAELNELISRSSASTTLLKSSVDEIIALAEADNLEGITPKYRVKGFWPVPEPMVSARTGNQDVVQFRVQYRYISKDGGSNQPDQITFKDNSGVERRGTFSNWEEFLTPVRKRSKDPYTGKFSWDIEDVENADSVNINQLEIPIKQGEGVEIRIKSLSEAGWPANPAESAWTDLVMVDFPDELVSSNELLTILEQARLSSESLEVQAALNDSGVTEHISAQFTQNETFYAHPSTMIASGFLTDEQNVVNLFEKLTEFSTRIRLIEEALTGEKGLLAITIVDDEQNEYIVAKNTLVQLFAGNYSKQAAGSGIPKGAIINKTYLLKLSNANASPLELYARQYGNYTQVVDSSTIGGTGYDANDPDYNTSRRYDVVPIGPNNLSSTNISTYRQFNSLPYQTGQVKGQYINLRYQNMDGTSLLYEDIVQSGGTPGYPAAMLPVDVVNNFPAPGTLTPGQTALNGYDEHEYLLSGQYNTLAWKTTASGQTSSNFIWSGIINGGVIETVPTNLMVVNDGIYVHELHPSILGWGQFGTLIGPGGTGAGGCEGVRNSGYAPLLSTAITDGGLKQAAYFDFASGATTNKDASFSKMSFEETDQYLIGPNSCGSYLFLTPPNNTGDINVDGSNQLSQKLLNFGSKYATFIPFVFQYRMTDFYGDGDTGIGNIGGDPSGITTQLEYTKRLGIDIYSNIDERFSFDIEITARYRSKSLQLQEVPSRSLINVVDDLTRTVRILDPSVSGIKAENSNKSDSNLAGSI